MELFVKVIFGIYLFAVSMRIIAIASGTWEKPNSIGTYCADTVLASIIMIWAAFVLWW